jgi:hypothetical protein
MMNRRAFFGNMGALGMLATSSAVAAAETNKRIFVFQQFFLKQGTQGGRMNEYLKTAVQSVGKVHSGPLLVLEAVVAAHQPQIAVIAGFDSFGQISEVDGKLSGDAALPKAIEALENHPEAPCEHFTTTLLEATDYCPEIKADPNPPAVPRIFEVRVYHSPTYRQLKALHERFAGPEIKIFHRVGVNPILYSSTVFGNNMPNLTYVIPFANLAEREKAWNAFSADPEWVKVRAESIEKAGQISISSQIILYKATPYSPIR